MTSTTEQYRALLAEQPVIPSPMCGISDYAFRAMCRRHGGPLAFTQMVAAEGIVRNDKKTVEILNLHAPEPRVAMQLFGCDPEKLGESARRLQDLGAILVDLNMGCPAKKVTGSMGGSALLRHPDLARKIFRAMRAALTIPFTAKMRWDWDEDDGGDSGAAPVIGKIAEEEGVDGLCLHARTREEGYSGHADWSRIAQLKEAVSIPVVGNGDVRAPEHAVAMMRQTGCDGVMVGRAAIGGPWLLGQSLARVHRELGLGAAPAEASGGESPSGEFSFEAEPDWAARRAIILEHARLMVEAKGPRGLVEFRKHAAAYLRGVRGGKKLRVGLMKVGTLGELEAALPATLMFDPEDEGLGDAAMELA